MQNLYKVILLHTTNPNNKNYRLPRLPEFRLAEYLLTKYKLSAWDEDICKAVMESFEKRKYMYIHYIEQLYLIEKKNNQFNLYAA